MPYTTLMLIIVLFAGLVIATYMAGTRPQYTSQEDNAGLRQEDIPVHYVEDDFQSADDYLLDNLEFDELTANLNAGLPEYAPAVPYLVSSDDLGQASDITKFTFMLFVFEAETSC